MQNGSRKYAIHVKVMLFVVTYLSVSGNTLRVLLSLVRRLKEYIQDSATRALGRLRPTIIFQTNLLTVENIFPANSYPMIVKQKRFVGILNTFKFIFRYHLRRRQEKCAQY